MVCGTIRATLCTLALLSWNAGAAEFDSSRTSADVRLSGIYTDNFYYDTGDEPQTSAMGGVVNPRAAYQGMIGRFNLLATLEGELATFDLPGGADDYEDADVATSLSWLATSRGRLDMNAGFRRSHDPFGTNRTENGAVLDQELDIWNGARAGLLFHYGAPEAVLNAEVGMSATDKSYQTNEAATRFLDYQTSTLQYTVFYNFSAKTAALLDFIRTDVRFDEPFAAGDARSGDEFRLRTGVRWLATAKTSGDIRIGAYRREFDDSSFTEEGLDWQAGLQWAPRARTLLDLSTSRESQESYRADTRVNVTRSVALGWKQYWGARTSSQLTADHTTSDFVGFARKDTLYNVGLSVDYTLTRTMTAVFAVNSLMRTSNEPTSEFDRLSTYLGIRLGY